MHPAHLRTGINSDRASGAAQASSISVLHALIRIAKEHGWGSAHVKHSYEYVSRIIVARIFRIHVPLQGCDLISKRDSDHQSGSLPHKFIINPSYQYYIAVP